jgi:predicted ribosomally synthesized peptide with nif11-like leader
MSVESAKAFYERLMTDEEFRNQHRNAASDEARRSMVLDAGYDFTPEEWDAAMLQLAEAAESELNANELSEADLASVSGGVLMRFPFPIKPPIVFPMYGIGLPNTLS